MATPTPVRFAVLGAGMVAEYHQQAIAAHAERGARLEAVVHHDPARFAGIEARFGVPCRSLEDVLRRSDIDIVSICTPSGQHAAQALACIDAGKHVLVEKPMALSLDDADAMIEAARARGVKLAVALQRRMDPLFRRVHDAVRGGDLGALTMGVVTMPYFRGQPYYDQAAWRGTWALDGGGVLMNQGIHIIDQLVWLMGDPVRIQAFARTAHRSIEVEDLVAATLEFETGAVATVTATTTVGGGMPHRIEVYGTNGGIQIEGERVVRWALDDPSLQTVSPPALSASGEAGSGADPRGISTAGHAAVVGDLIDAIRTDRPPAIDGPEGRRALAAILGIYRAAGLPSGLPSPG